MMDPCFQRKWLGAVLLSSMAAFAVLRTNEVLWANQPLWANVPLLAAPSVRVSSQDEMVVEPAVREAASRVQKLATRDPAAFAAILRQAFGPRLKPEVERELVQQAGQGKLPFAGLIVFVPADDLPGAGAAYARENGGVIFLSADFRSDAAALAELILHEWGHHLDAVLGAGYSPLEAGVVFLQGVKTGAPIPAAGLRSSGALDDAHATIEFEGRTVPVECNWFTKHFVDPVANIAKAAVKMVEKTVTSTVNIVKNAALTVANTTVGIAKGVASGVMLAVGDKKKSAELAAGARSSFESAGTSAKDLGNSVVDRLAAAGDLFNTTSKELNKVAPLLGTAVDIGIGLTPFGPYYAFSKGVADVKSVVEHGGNAGEIAGTVGFALMDVGGSALGRVAGGIKFAKASGALAIGKPATKYSQALEKHLTNKAKWSTWDGFKRKSGALIDDFKAPKERSGYAVALEKQMKRKAPWYTLDGFKREAGKLSDKIKGPTTDKWKYTKPTTQEIAFGRKLVEDWWYTTKMLEYAKDAKSVNLLVRTQDFIPGRDRDDEGKLTGKGGNEWQHRFEAVKESAESTVDLFKPKDKPEDTPDGNVPKTASGGGSSTEPPPQVTVSGGDDGVGDELPTQVVKKKPRRSPNTQVQQREPDDGTIRQPPSDPPTDDGDDMEDGDDPTRGNAPTDDGDDMEDGDGPSPHDDTPDDGGDDGMEGGENEGDDTEDGDGPTRSGDDEDDAMDGDDDGPTRGDDDSTDDGSDDGPTRRDAGDEDEGNDAKDGNDDGPTRP